MTRYLAAVLVLGAALTACDSGGGEVVELPPSGVDAAGGDTGQPPDTAAPDTATPLPDTGPTPDTGTPDTAAPPDTGAPDTAAPDTGPPPSVTLALTDEQGAAASALDVVHTFGGSPCPQPLGTVTATNGTDAPAQLTLGLQRAAAVGFAPGASLTVAPGATETVAVQFTCASTDSFETGVDVTLTSAAASDDLSFDVTLTVVGVPPAVVSTTPPDGGVANKASNPDIRVLFDRPVDPASVGAEVKEAATEPESYVSVSAGSTPSEIVIKMTSPPFMKPGVLYRGRVQGAAALDGTKMVGKHEWTFSAPGCGDGVCEGIESICTCPQDCGPCAGCCEWQGGDSYACLPGKAKDKCGSNGQTCGVCTGTDQCIDGKGCG